jgi:hypothetical protein
MARVPRAWLTPTVDPSTGPRGDVDVPEDAPCVGTAGRAVDYWSRRRIAADRYSHSRRAVGHSERVTEPDGWRVEGGPDVRTGNAAADFARDAISAGQTYIRFVRSEEQSLTFGTNGARVALVLWSREGHDEGMQAIEPAAGQGSQDGYVLENGQRDNYPDRDTVSVDRAIEAVRHIVDSNTPDPRLQWRSW